MDIKEYNVETKHNKQNHPWEYARAEVVLSIINNVFKKEKNNLTILDIGCGDAFFLEQISKHFKDSSFYAIDTAFSSEDITFFEEKYKGTGIKFYKNTSDIDTVVQKIDVILLLDVIEHIENDVDFLSSLRSISGFNSETLVITTVPAFQSLFCLHDKWLGHHRRYSLPRLEKLIRFTGFTTISSGYFFTSLLLPRILQRSKERFLKIEDENTITGVGDWNGSEFTTSLIKNVLLIDYKITRLFQKIGIKIPGLSCYSVCIDKKIKR